MIKIKSVTARNFLSIGNVTQSVNLDRTDLTLILGENLDLGGDDSGARNGTGKSALLNIVSYALYGNALTNIKKDNLINRTNGKNMLVTIDFEKDNIAYKIERGRKPNVMKFYVADVEREITDESQGDSRETQAEIERLICMSHNMFKHIVALNTYTEPFLSLKANEQREIIEQLLGITLLSEKADVLKERIRVSKDSIQQEEFRIKAVIDANKRIEEQIGALKRRQSLWVNKHTEECNQLQLAYDQLNQIDIDAEILAHRALETYNQRRKDINDLNSAIKRSNLDYHRETKDVEKFSKEIVSLENHACHSCGQAFHNERQEKLLADKKQALAEAETQLASTAEQLQQLNTAVAEIGELGTQPQVFYDREADAVEHRATLANLQVSLANKQNETDPYTEQIEEMTRTALEEINYDLMNQLTSTREHEEFLLKLLTNKDSFIRKKIIDQNLNYLNTRLGYYLEKIGLPHQVEFQNDLTVSITELGRDLDFDNLSRGERNRLILSLSWAFRDVWESLYQKINLLFVDELVDSGLDSSGMESSLAILKKISRDSKKSVWLVSHRDELVARVENILRVTKSNGFTTYGSDVEV
jgi:DNA repair exonuclease SbcCD ATPase subunit